MKTVIAVGRVIDGELVGLMLADREAQRLFSREQSRDELLDRFSDEGDFYEDPVELDEGEA
ncbi:MAG: hypothetical protein KGL39_38525 [Patescibacteria group bacterium]|nr:hypothetical protein [Patescibacteria group bacterium]